MEVRRDVREEVEIIMYKRDVRESLKSVSFEEEIVDKAR